MRQALVLGGAVCLFSDIARVHELGLLYDGVVACNAAGAVWPGLLDAWVTIHPQFFLRGPSWLNKRKGEGFTPAKALYSNRQHHTGVNPKNLILTDYELPGLKKFGSSGLFAVKIALVDLKYDSVLLCGMPMTSSRHFDREEDWRSAIAFREQWLGIEPWVAMRIKSMSGWTKQHFGGY